MALVVDATAWTGCQQATYRERALNFLVWIQARPLLPAEAPGLHAVVGVLAQRAGIARPAVFLASARHLGDAYAAALPALGAVVFTPSGLALTTTDPVAAAGLVAHEMAHIAAGHGPEPGYALALRPGAGVALVASVALGSAPLIVAAMVAFAAQEAAHRRWTARREREADELAARYLGSVAPLLPRRGPLSWSCMLERLGSGYPFRRPWLDRMAARELAEMHAAAGSA